MDQFKDLWIYGFLLIVHDPFLIWVFLDLWIYPKNFEQDRFEKRYFRRVTAKAIKILMIRKKQRCIWARFDEQRGWRFNEMSG